MSGKSTIKEQMNEWAGAGIPFLFIIDFEQLKPLAFRLDEINPENLLYDINGITNCHDSPAPLNPAKLVKYPEAYADYLVKFNKVKDEIANGNTFLLNLTCSTPVDLNSTLAEIFHMSSARYKIWFDDQFVCFSPESFVIISNGMIRSFPMKGTIDADSPDAENSYFKLDPKETAEHYTIVDLIRNRPQHGLKKGRESGGSGILILLRRTKRDCCRSARRSAASWMWDMHHPLAISFLPCFRPDR